MILKDTEDNRKIQKRLADEVQLTPYIFFFFFNDYQIVHLFLIFYCFSGGHLYIKERKKSMKPELKSLVAELAIISIDNSLVEDDNILEHNSLVLPERGFPDMEFPDNLKRFTGYDCYLVHKKNNV